MGVFGHRFLKKMSARRQISLLVILSLLGSAVVISLASPAQAGGRWFVDTDLRVTSYDTRTNTISLAWSNQELSGYNVLSVYGWHGPEVDGDILVGRRREIFQDNDGAWNKQTSVTAQIDPYGDSFYVQLQWYCYGDCPSADDGSEWGDFYSEAVLVSGSKPSPTPTPTPTPALKKGTLSVSDAAMFEGEAGGLQRVMQFRVSLTWPADATAQDKDQTVTVNYSTSDGSTRYPRNPRARAGIDYTAVLNGVLTFKPGYKSLLAPVTLIGDSRDEGEPLESKMGVFTVTLSNPKNAIVVSGGDKATGKIYDNDGPEVFGPTGGPTIGAIAGGSVQITVPPAAPTAAGSGTTLNPGSTLSNSGATSATVNFPDGTSIVLAPGATLGWSEDPSLFNQASGTVWYSLVPKLNMAWGVGTRFATLAIRGTTFTVDGGTKGDRVEVYDGTVEATGDGDKTVSVTGGQATTCAESAPCTKPVAFESSDNPFWGPVEVTEEVPEAIKETTELSISYYGPPRNKRGNFTGFVTTGHPESYAPCEEGRPVTVKKVANGRDEVIGRATSRNTRGFTGLWDFWGPPASPGRYYAVVPKKVFSDTQGITITCLKDQSRTIAVR